MVSSSSVITLIHHPTVALKILGFRDPAFTALSQGAYLGNIYRRIIPPSLPRVASVIERDLSAGVRILDLRIADFKREETYKNIDWEGYQIEARRVGAPFSYANDLIEASDWIGLSSHFTFEAGIVRDLIRHIKYTKPAVKVMVGGADVKARPNDYLAFGADLVFEGDFNARALADYNGTPTIAGPYRESFDKLLTPAFARSNIPSNSFTAP